MRYPVVALCVASLVGGCTIDADNSDGVPTPACGANAGGSTDDGPCSWDAPSMPLGVGPSADISDAIGVADRNHVVLATSNSVIISVNLATGNRQLVTGTLADWGSIGSGPTFDGADVIRLGPDGAYYVHSANITGAGTTDGIVRVDPQSGERTVYVDLAHAPCPGTVQGAGGFAFGQVDGVYVILAGSNGFSGVGLLTGGTCSVVANPELSLADPTDLQFANDTLWVVDSDIHALVRMDPSTGLTTIVSQSGDVDTVGDGDDAIASGVVVLGDAAWMPASSSSTIAVRIDLSTGDRTELGFSGAFAPGSFGGISTIIGDSTRGLLYCGVREGEGIVVASRVTGSTSWLSSWGG